MVRLKVILDVYSGNPNPSWEMPPEKVKEFFEMKGWKELMNPEDFGLSLGLGYSGFIISVLSKQIGKLGSSDRRETEKLSNLPDRFRILGSKKPNGLNGILKPSISPEEIIDKEKWLLGTSGDLLPTNLRQYVEQSISHGSDSSESDNIATTVQKKFTIDTFRGCNLYGAIYSPGFWNTSLHYISK